MRCGVSVGKGGALISVILSFSRIVPAKREESDRKQLGSFDKLLTGLHFATRQHWHLGLGPLGVQIAILLSWRRSLFCCAVAGCFCGHLHDSLVALGAGTFIFLWGQVPELESSLVDLVTDYGASSALHLRLGRRWA